MVLEKQKIIDNLIEYARTAKIKDMEEIRNRLNELIFNDAPREIVSMINRISGEAWHAETIDEAKEVVEAAMDEY